MQTPELTRHNEKIFFRDLHRNYIFTYTTGFTLEDVKRLAWEHCLVAVYCPPGSKEYKAHGAFTCRITEDIVSLGQAVKESYNKTASFETVVCELKKLADISGRFDVLQCIFEKDLEICNILELYHNEVHAIKGVQDVKKQKKGLEQHHLMDAISMLVLSCIAKEDSYYYKHEPTLRKQAFETWLNVMTKGGFRDMFLGSLRGECHVMVGIVTSTHLNNTWPAEHKARLLKELPEALAPLFEVENLIRDIEKE